MTTFGFHYIADDLHYRASDLSAWLPELRAMQARWLTVLATPERAIPEPFLQGLRQAEIEPIVHLPAHPGRTTVSLEPLFAAYARWGVRYVSVFSEPNARASWPAADWGRPGLVDRFLDLMTPVWNAQLAAGLPPVFPPLKAGGDFWDTAFLEAALAGLKRRGHTSLLKALVFAVNLWTFNRPTDWGAGGRSAWPHAKPYAAANRAQDQRGFRLFEWHHEIIAAATGESRPMLCLAGGPRLGDQTDPNLPAADELWHASCIQSLLGQQSAGQLPDYLLNVNFWLLAAPTDSGPRSTEAWYRPDGSTLAGVALLKRAAAQAKHWERRGGPVPAMAPRPLRHYLLLPAFAWGVSDWHWGAALDYVKAHRPVCGFSAEEAARAERVTIFGDEQDIGADVEAALKRAGCSVERLAASPAQPDGRPIQE